MQTAAASGHRRVGLSEPPETAPSDPTGPRFLVEDIYPSVDGGRYPLKRIAGEPIEVWADLLREGHDQLAAELLWRKESETDWRREPMLLAGNDRWHGQFTPPEPGRYLFAVETWTDQFATWRKGVLLHREAGHVLTIEAQEGRELLGELNVRDANIKRIIDWARRQFDRVPDVETLLADDLAEAVAASDPRGDLTRSIAIPVIVDRPRARAGAWYEMVPRSQGTVPGQHGTFDDCIARLPDIAALGFDVVYLTPIHPIGMTNRKG
jgi:starch synthase (maltosyl-transferring)